MTLTATSIGLAVELGEAKSALTYLASVYGETIDLPATLDGRISGSLTRNAAQDFTLAFNIDRKVTVAGTLPDHRGAYQFTSEARTPIFSLRANGNTKTLSATLDVGPTAASLPWHEVKNDSLVTGGTFALDLRGVTGAISIAEGDTSLKFTGLGLGGGNSSLKLDGTQLLGVTLNPGSAGKFALTLTPQGASQPSIAVNPEFDLALALDLRKLRDAGDSVDAALVQDTYRVKFDGSSPSAQAVDSTATFPGGLKILTGNVALSSATQSQTVTVHAGKCLVGNDAVTAGENEIVGKFAERDCP
jgi:hypothetical protein